MATAERIAGTHSNPYVNALLWGGWGWTGTIHYYLDDNPYNWGEIEKTAFRQAFQSWANVANISFEETGGRDNANFVETLFSGDPSYLGEHNTPDDAAGNDNRATGYYNYQGVGWDWKNPYGGLQKGGFGYMTLVHELGHALGLAHPHDNGGGSDTFPGVSETFSPGSFNLNQDVYTVMSYVHGYVADSPNGAPNTDTYGHVAGPSAFDIAAIQYLYGANNNYMTGSDDYVLPSSNNDGTYWICIWDAGGIDTIRNDSSSTSVIDLTPATLKKESGGGGDLSRVWGVEGGFTIAAGVVIENARGGSNNDRITGNSYVNHLWGNGGDDTLFGDEGDDYLYGGGGDDFLICYLGAETIYSGSGNDTYAFTADSRGGEYFPDFDHANDQIRIVKYGFGIGSTWDFVAGTSATAVERTFLWDKTTGQFIYDANGSNAGGKTLLATVIVDPASTAVDTGLGVDGSGDFNGDGSSDIVWRNTNGEALIWQMQNGQRVNGHYLGEVDGSWRLATFGDFTGDGTDDVLWHNEVSGEVVMWRMQDSRKDNGFLLGFIDSTWKVEGSGDFNGDGTQDFIFRNQVSNESVVWTMNNGVKSQGYGLGVIDNAWMFDGSGDFDNDGTDDVAFRNANTGELLLWKMQNGEKSNGYLLGAIDRSWEIASTGDTNNDGTADIVWTNGATGEALTWTVGNLAKTNGFLSAKASSGWSVAGSGDFDNNNISDLIWRKVDGSVATAAYNVWNQADMFSSNLELI